MLTTVEAYSSQQQAPILPLGARGAQTDLVQVLNIDGLGPVKTDISTTPYGSIDGDAYNGAHTPGRNIVIDVGLNPDWNLWSFEALRRLLYAYFMPKAPVQLVFSSDDDFPTVYINGVTESVEPAMFDKQPSFQVSILCPDPYFMAQELTVVTGPVINGAHPGVPIKHDYKGSIETGFNLKILQVSAPNPSYLTVQVGDPAKSRFRVLAGVSPTQEMLISSVPGSKYVQNVNNVNGVITNLLYKVEEGSTWPVLKPGINDFSVLSDAGAQSWELSYFQRFGGL